MASVKYAGVAAVGLRARGLRGIDVARADAEWRTSERRMVALRPVVWFGPARPGGRVDVALALGLTAIMGAVALLALVVLGMSVLALGGYWG